MLTVGLLPGPADDLRLVECDAACPFELVDVVESDIHRSLSLITQAMPVGLLDLGDGRVHARWGIATDAHDVLDQDTVVTSIVMFDLLQQHFGDDVEDVCSGGVDARMLPELMRLAGDAP